MKRIILGLIICLFTYSQSQAQSFKPTPKFKPMVNGAIKVQADAQPELFKSVNGNSADYKNVNTLALPRVMANLPNWKFIKDPETGNIIAGKGSLPQKNWTSQEAQAKDYFKALGSLQNSDDLTFEILSKNISTTGTHFRFHQTYKGLPVMGTEGVLHAKAGIIYSFSGQIKNDFSIDIQPSLQVDQALEIAKQSLSGIDVNWQEIPEQKLFLIEAQNQVEADLKIILSEKGTPALVWELSLCPNIQERWKVLVNAHTGAVESAIPAFCKFWHNPLKKDGLCNHHSSDHNEKNKVDFLPPPAIAQATDLTGTTRTINVYQEGSTFYMIDASRSMFNSNLSDFPDDPQGVIWTLDAFNTYPQNTNFNYGHITSSNNSWNNPNAVSAHFNGGKAFEYFQDTHNRNSINGQGGNIISLIRVSDPDGEDFDNAFWNGAAMFYGNGNQAFNASLAKGLDVAGHEMSHGVIQATANLTYQNQSGALNESFADIFGAMIDRDDWFIGEDVANPAVFPTGRMRDLSDPNNGGNANNFYWQPKHMDEFRNLPNTQDGDWGGVHINSGIPNHAFFRFANNVGKDDAEKVYYEVLENHLTANSKFIDLRIAVVEVAEAMLGPNGKAAAETAFDEVGILSGQGSDVQQDIDENPGEEVVIWSDLSRIGFFFPANLDQPVISNQDHLTRPSITDDGTYAVYIDNQNRIIQVAIDWTNSSVTESLFENNPQTIWRNVVVSKDGSKLAVLTTNGDNRVLIFDRASGITQAFDLYNPTTAQGVSTGDVQFADVMEWDASGEFLMYDAFNELQNNTFQDISYWDIGMIKVWDNAANDFSEGQVLKLFNGLQENESVGNPTFSKNSPYIIAFDYITTDFFGEDTYTILGANIETGNFGEIWENAKLGYPSYSPEDDEILFSAVNTGNEDVLGKRALAADKITGIDDPVVFVNGPVWGHWFANGERDLVSAQDLIPGSIKLFPNPAFQQVHLQFEGIEKGQYTLRLINILGAVTLSQPINIGTDRQLEILELSSIPAGTYFLEISNENGQSKTEKLLIR